MDQTTEKAKRTQRIESARTKLAECESAVKSCNLLQDYAWTTAQNPFLAWKLYASPRVTQARVSSRENWLKASEALAKLLKKKHA